jgi:hypothetical protein
MTPTPTRDDDLRALFAPLAADEPHPAQIAALRRRAPARRRHRRQRAIAGIATATAAAAAALALLSGSQTPRGSEAAAGILRTAAAVAAEQPVPPPSDAPLRYAKVRATFSYVAREGDRTAQQHAEQVAESWVGAKWKGRSRAARGRTWNTGDRALAREAFGGSGAPLPPRDTAYAYGDGPLAELDPATLPEDREAIAAVLREGIRLDRWGPYPESRGEDNGPSGAARDSYVTYAFIGLLVNARLTPAQRAALLDVLAGDPAARDLGRVTDREGREGRGVALEYAAGDAGLAAPGYRIVFDPRTSEILEWAMERPAVTPADPQRRTVAGSPSRVETVLSTGYVDEIGERP